MVIYFTGYLARQDLINKQGDTMGLSNLASHLRTHEPYTLALSYLLQWGVLNTDCKMTDKGMIAELAAKHYPGEVEAELLLSGLKYSLGSSSLGHGRI